jgi:hypothetical protein
LGALVWVGGGPIRNYQINDQPKKPAGAAAAAGKDPAMKDPAMKDPAAKDPAAANDPADPAANPKPPMKRKK